MESTNNYSYDDPNNNNSPSKKRKDADNFNISVISAPGKYSSKNMEDKKATVMKVAVDLHAEGHFKKNQHEKKFSHKEITKVVVLGTQSTGKSSLVAALMSNIVGTDLNVCPTHEKMCTTAPLDVSFCDTGAGLELRLHDGKTVVCKDDKEVSKHLREFYALRDEGSVSFSMEDAASLKIKSNKSFRFVDMPGPRVHLHLESFFRGLLVRDQDSLPIVVLTINCQTMYCDIGQEPTMIAFKGFLQNNPDIAQNLSIFLVITHAECVNSDDQVLKLAKSCNQVQAILQSIVMNVKIALVQLRIPKHEEASQKTIRDAELKLFENENLKSATTESGDKLFILGVNQLARVLSSELADSIVKDKEFLVSLRHGVQSKLTSTNILLETANSRMSWQKIGNEMVESVKKGDFLIKGNVKASHDVRTVMRKLLDIYYQSELTIKKLNRLNSPYNEGRLPSSTEMIEADTEWRRIIDVFLDYLVLHVQDVVQKPMDRFMQKITRCINSYAFKFMPSVQRKTYDFVYNFNTSNLESFYEEIRTTLRKQKAFIEQKPTEDIDELKADWPKDSAIIKDAKLDNQDFAFVLIRVVLKTMVTLLSHLVNNIVINIAEYQRRLLEDLQKSFSNIYGNVPETESDTRKTLEEDKKLFIETLDHVDFFINRIHAAEMEKRKEVERERAKKLKTDSSPHPPPKREWGNLFGQRTTQEMMKESIPASSSPKKGDWLLSLFSSTSN